MKIGQRVAFRTEGRKNPVIGTVRAIKGNEARVDNGAADNPDLHTNGFTVSAWVRLADLTVIP